MFGRLVQVSSFVVVLAAISALDGLVLAQSSDAGHHSSRGVFRRNGRSLLAGLWNDIEDFWNRNTLGLSEGSIEHDGLSRRFLEHKPTSFPSTGGALVLLLHGANGTMYRLFRKVNQVTRRWVTLSDNEGFFLLAPNAWTQEREGQVWNDYRESQSTDATVDDVGFIVSLVQWAIQERGVDPSRVYVTGTSNGGEMTYRLLIDSSDTFAAGAAFVANLIDEKVPNVASPTPIMIVSGREDPLMKWEGGPVGNNRGTVRSALATRDFWINANNVDSAEVVRSELPDLDPFDGCRISSDLFQVGGAPVLFYTMAGAGHYQPTRLDRFQLYFFGPPCHDAEGADLAWEFMSTHG